jgi:hypothetical protein
MKCDEGYRCEICGKDVESLLESELYLHFVLGDVPLEKLHLLPERHIRCNPELAQYIVDSAFESISVEGPFDKRTLDAEYVREEEIRITAAWHRLKSLPTMGRTILEYPKER